MLACAGWAVSRAVVVVAVVVAAQRAADIDTFGAFFRWDGSWYTVIAEHGYPSVLPTVDGHVVYSSIAFFPVFPAMVRGVVWATGMPYTWAALLVVNIASCA